MTVCGTNIAMIRGDSDSLTVGIKHGSFSPGDVVTLTVRPKVCCPIAVQKVVTEFDEDGKAVISFAPSDTEGLPFGVYLYDIQWKQPDGTVITIVPVSRFELLEEVTY